MTIHFALIAGVYTQDFSTSWRASREIDAGLVFINNYNRNFYATGFGGNRHSGFGREHAYETLREYGHTKTVRITTGIGDVPQWFAANDVFQSED